MGSGMIGVAVTDAIQYVLIVLLLCSTIPVSLNALRKVGIEFGELIREPFFSSGDQKARFFYTAWPMIIGNLFSYEYFMRFMSCKGLKEAKKASLLAGIFLLIAALPVALLGAVANACYQDVADDEVFGMILKNELSPTIRILLMAAVLMAILTSADSMLTSVSGMISRDLYAGLILRNKPVTEVKNFRIIIKVSMVVVAAVAAVCALHFTQILQITFFFSPLTSGVMFAPMIIGLFWKKASRKGAVLSVITGAMAALLHITGIVTLFDRVAGPALVGSVALIVFSFLFPD